VFTPGKLKLIHVIICRWIAYITHLQHPGKTTARVHRKENLHAFNTSNTRENVHSYTSSATPVQYTLKKKHQQLNKQSLLQTSREFNREHL